MFYSVNNLNLWYDNILSNKSFICIRDIKSSPVIGSSIPIASCNNNPDNRKTFLLILTIVKQNGNTLKSLKVKKLKIRSNLIFFIMKIIYKKKK